MIVLLCIIAQLLLVIILLAIIGLPLLVFVVRRVIHFENFNFAQLLLLSIYFGALVLYILALIPLPMFKYEVIAVILFLCLVSTAIPSVKSLEKCWKHLGSKFKGNLFELTIVFTLFLISLTIQVVPLTSLVFGSIHDTSLHALFAQLIIENGRIPETHEPYLQAAIIFPQGASVIFAFSSLILNISTPLAVFRTTVIFNALTVLAAYNFGRILDKRRFAGISYAFIFAFVSMWPTHMTWGGNSFIVGVPLFLIIASLLRSEYSKGLLPGQRVLFYTIKGLLLGYLAAIHIALFISLVICWILLVLFSHRSFSKVKLEFSRIMPPFITFIISIALISPYLCRGLMYYHLPGGNIGLPEDVVDSQQSLIPLANPRITLNGIKDFILTITNQYNISPHFVTRIMTIILLSLSVLTIVTLKLRRKQITPAETIGSTLCLASAFLFSMEPINPIATISQRANLIIYISLMLLLGGFNLRVAENMHRSLSLTIKSQKKLTLIVLIIMVSIYSPFIYYRLVEDPYTLKKMYQIFAITTNDDLNLMLWMKDNLPPNSTILINPFEPGLFIPPLAQKKVIYPFTAYQLSSSYQQVVCSIGEKKLSNKVFDYLQHHNISHIYISSVNDAWFFKGHSALSWDPHLFLGNPNFKLLKRVNNTFLFKYSPIDHRLVLMDSFECDTLDHGGWRITQWGDGIGNAIITNESAFDGSRALMLCVKSEKTPYWLSILRPVYLYDSLNVTLSFYIDVANGFGSKDALLIIISDANWNRQLYFTTNPRISLKYPPIHLPSDHGYFEFNLSDLWKEIHGEQLPMSFFVQVLNYDEDGVENLAYVDAISLGINTSHIFAQYTAKFVYKFELSDSPMYGWKYCERGKGIGTINVIDDGTLLLKSQTVEDWYWSSVYTDVRLSCWTGHNVYISFNICAAGELGEYDAVMLIISDQSWNKQVYFSTNDKVPVPPHLLIPMLKEGFQEFNLSNIWTRIHGDFLPNRFFMQVLNYDSDGIENIVYVNVIEIKVS